jgi:thiol-disulfide isomerase/thioredoxin
MLKMILQFTKSLFTIIIIVAILQFTGLWGSVATTLQTAILKTGLLNADAEVISNELTNFDYDFSITKLGGEIVTFNQFKGKVVFLNLWATWCGPCKAEMPGIQSLANKLKEHDIDFVVLSVDKAPAEIKVKSYIDKNQFTFPVYLKGQYVPELLQVPSIPTTFILNREGKIIFKEVGFRNYDTKKMMNFLINQSQQK